jgi:hypothetical protein
MKSQKVKEKAAALVAEGKWTRPQIAHECNISLRCLDNWNRDPKFQKLTETHLGTMQSMLSSGMGDSRRRVSCLTDQAFRCVRLIEARASDPALQQIPGIDSGLLRRRIKVVAGRPIGEVVTDTEPVRRLQSLLKQVAMEVQPLLDRQQNSSQVSAESTDTEPDFKALSTEESTQFLGLLHKINGSNGQVDES